MNTGVIAALGLAVAAGLAWVAKSQAPEVQRYRKIRKM
jgi:uncharacterized protein DUF6893